MMRAGNGHGSADAAVLIICKAQMEWPCLRVCWQGAMSTPAAWRIGPFRGSLPTFHVLTYCTYYGRALNQSNLGTATIETGDMRLLQRRSVSDLGEKDTQTQGLLSILIREC